MRATYGVTRHRNAQTLVFFAVACLSIILLCGLAIDSGVLYLAKARLARAADGAALAAVGNFHRSDIASDNRDKVATIMRNFAVANYTDLGSIGTTGSATPGGIQTSYTTTSGQTAYTYTYSFNDGTQDANGQYKRFVQVVLTTGSGGAITSATCNARCPVHTYFIGFAGSYFKDLKVSSSAIATRNPRLIMVVIDRSASMLQSGGGAYGLPPAIVQFLDFFDTTSDNIGIVSFGSSARLEMPLTTNFIVAGTNNLIDAYETNAFGGEPGVDPEQIKTNVNYPTYLTTGVRRLKFGGQTAADDGIRLGMEQLMANSGFNDPDVLKYMVIFTDGKWNQSRTLLAAPGYTNEVTVPNASSTIVFLTNAIANSMTNGQSPGPWQTTLASDTNLVPMPTLSPLPGVTNAIQALPTSDFATLAPDHYRDTWLSVDGQGAEPLTGSTTQVEGGSISSAITTNSWVGSSGTTNYYTHNIDVWLQPGSVAYMYTNGSSSPAGTYVSDYTNPTKHINLKVPSGGKVDLVVPGYVVDGLFFDALDLCYPDTPAYGASLNYPRYKVNNFQEDYMWPDDAESPTAYPYQSTSLMRQLMFRNYVNLLTGFYVFRADEPVGAGLEPLIKDYSSTGYPRPIYGNGPYYPSAGFYSPFGDINNYVATNSPDYGIIGIDQDPTFSLRDPTVSAPDDAHHIAYSINMLSTNAAPEWSGEWFYEGTGGTNSISGFGTTSVSTIMSSAADWQVGAPSWLINEFSAVMTSDATHNSNITPNPVVWRPAAFNGSNGVSSDIAFSSILPGDLQNLTHGYVSDGSGHYYRNTMAWSGRPTHYFDFSQGKWIPVGNNHVANTQALPLGYWKAWEYCWHARAMGVTIYTVGYGSLVSDSQQVFLAQIANATNSTGYSSTNGGVNIPVTYNPTQPIGLQFYATTSAQISNDFYAVGQSINAALTQ